MVHGLSLLGVREASKAFLRSMSASSRYSDSYLASLEQTLGFFSAYVEDQGLPPVTEIEPEHVEEYLLYLKNRPRWFGERNQRRQKPVSQSHIESQYRRLKTFWNWLVRRGHVTSNPLHSIPHPHIDERTIETISDQEAQNLLRVTDPHHGRTWRERFMSIRNRAVLMILLDTPSRRHELATLKMSNVDVDAGQIKVMGKGRKERWMALGNTALEAVWDYLRERERLAQEGTEDVWVDQQGFAMHPDWLYRMLIRVGRRANIQNLHTHRFRHTYAVNALKAGMPERLLRIGGGWRRIPDTYFRTLDEEDYARVHREISPADRLNGQRSVKMNAKRGKSRGVL